MGMEPARALAALRLSLGRWSTDTDIDVIAAAVADAAR
ncbi:cysteine desulfurase [Amycolatopsis australiensis]|uniref:Cysteine desulfurase n=1 Tax=Amycolatopsis australiensis TaxID=546364 RepID=A0A1K1SRP1_9PSEU|nr:cysteine desulfurase [Amycolatopsis australiensis]